MPSGRRLRRRRSSSASATASATAIVSSAYASVDSTMCAAISQLCSFERVTGFAFDRRRGDHAGDDHEHGADAGEARPQPGQRERDQADRPADQRGGLGDGERQRRAWSNTLCHSRTACSTTAIDAQAETRDAAAAGGVLVGAIDAGGEPCGASQIAGENDDGQHEGGTQEKDRRGLAIADTPKLTRQPPQPDRFSLQHVRQTD